MFRCIKNESLQLGRIEIHICHGGKKGIEGKLFELLGTGAGFGGPMRKDADAFQGMEQKILQGCRLGGFAADADRSAACALGGLLALITEHGTHGDVGLVVGVWL